MRPSYRALFGIPGIPRLVASMLLARTAGQMTSLILVLFALERYKSPTIAGVATFLSIAPGLLVSPIAGALLDRHGRTRLVVLDYSVAAISLALLGALGFLAVLLFGRVSTRGREHAYLAAAMLGQAIAFALAISARDAVVIAV